MPGQVPRPQAQPQDQSLELGALRRCRCGVAVLHDPHVRPRARDHDPLELRWDVGSHGPTRGRRNDDLVWVDLAGHASRAETQASRQGQAGAQAPSGLANQAAPHLRVGGFVVPVSCIGPYMGLRAPLTRSNVVLGVMHP